MEQAKEDPRGIERAVRVVQIFGESLNKTRLRKQSILSIICIIRKT